MPQVVVGLEEALKLLTDAPLNVALLGMGRAARASINLIAADLARRTPIGHGETAGDLVKALKVEVTVDSQGRGVIALTGFRGPQAAVALWNEYGHHVVGHAPAFELLGEAQPRPFMRPCFDSQAASAIDVFASTLETELKKIYG